MKVNFSQIRVGANYSRKELAKLWGYSGYQGLARGVVTPKDDNKIILFITQEKPINAEQYQDKLTGDTLFWEGPTDHFAEERMLHAEESGDEIHVFYRERQLLDFTYEGKFKVKDSQILGNQSSRFTFVRN